MDGGILTRRELIASGMRDGDIARAVRAAHLVRIRPGWFAVPGADREIVRAVAAGGALACGAALRFHGVWIRLGPAHVAIDHGGRLRKPGAPAHWVRGVARRSVLSPAQALATYAACASELDVAIAADSALNRGILTDEEVRHALGATRRGRRIHARVDGRAESGIETIVRLGLRARRVQLRVQLPIAGVGRVDFVVGDRLVIEVDGEQWHAGRFEEDRARDAALLALGYLVMRFSYRRVMDDWAAVEQQILALIRRRAHRGRTRSRHTRSLA